MTTNTTQDQRWAQAEAILGGRQKPPLFPTSGMRHHRGYVALVIMVLVLLLVAFIAVALARGGHPSHHAVHHSSIPLWRGIIAGVLLVVGMALEVLGMVLLIRTGLFGRRWNSALSVLGQEHRTQLRQEVTGRAPFDPAHLPLARDYALRMTHQRWLTLVIVGVAVMELGAAVAALGAASLVLVAIAAGLVAMNLLTTRRSSQLGQRFLDQHPSDQNS